MVVFSVFHTLFRMKSTIQAEYCRIWIKIFLKVYMKLQLFTEEDFCASEGKVINKFYYAISLCTQTEKLFFLEYLWLFGCILKYVCWSQVMESFVSLEYNHAIYELKVIYRVKLCKYVNINFYLFFVDLTQICFFF